MKLTFTFIVPVVLLLTTDAAQVEPPRPRMRPVASSEDAEIRQPSHSNLRAPVALLEEIPPAPPKALAPTIRPPAPRAAPQQVMPPAAPKSSMPSKASGKAFKKANKAVKTKQEKDIDDMKAYAKTFAKADAMAEASEKKQRALRQRFRRQQRRKLQVAETLEQTTARLEHHQKHMKTIEKYGALTEERNAKDYLLDAWKFVSYKISQKMQDRDVLSKKMQVVEAEKAKVAEQENRIKIADDTLLGNMAKQRKEYVKLGTMIKMEDMLAKGVRDSQAERVNNLNAEIASDRRDAIKLQSKVDFETKHETKLAMKLAKIVNHERGMVDQRQML